MLNNNLILTWQVISEACVEHRFKLFFPSALFEYILCPKLQVLKTGNGSQGIIHSFCSNMFTISVHFVQMMILQ